MAKSATTSTTSRGGIATCKGASATTGRIATCKGASATTKAVKGSASATSKAIKSSASTTSKTMKVSGSGSCKSGAVKKKTTRPRMTSEMAKDMKSSKTARKSK